MPYREYSPPAHLASTVECFWTSETIAADAQQRVMPDACEDIVWIPGSGSLVAVGTMTRAQVFAHAAGQTIAGVRFLPSMARGTLGVPGDVLTDTTVKLDDLWGARGVRLRRRLSATREPGELVRLLGSELRAQGVAPLQKPALWVVEQRGRVRIDDLARLAGLSQRHLRRVFLEQTGLSPKMFCRVVRFRNLLRRIQNPRATNWVVQALEAGYYDQSHLVNEFREFAGVSPNEYAMAVFSNTRSSTRG